MGFSEYIVDESRFTNRFFRRFIDYLWLGVLTCMCSLGIITIGASFSSLYYCCNKIAKKEDYKLTDMFFKQFAANFKNGVVLTVVVFIVGVVEYTGFILLSSPGLILGDNAMLPEFVRGLILVVGAYLLLFLTHLFPLQATFENDPFTIMKNSLLITLVSFPSTVIICILYALPIVILYLWPFMIPIIVMFGFPIPYQISVYLYRKIFKKFGIVEETPEEEIIED